MSRLTILTREAAPATTQPLLDAVEKQLGVVPNMFRMLAQSPAVLQGYLGLSGALGKTLDLKTRERIAVAVAQVNGCDYCLSAHSYVGLNLAKVPAEEIARARQGGSADAKIDAALRFAVKVTETRGKVSAAELAAVREAGYSEAQVLEIVAVVAENIMTNLFNNVAETDIDFPAVHAA